jgi:general stress protein 26
MPTQKRVTLDVVLKELHKNHFAVLSTVGEAGVPRSAGVNYGIAPSDQDLTIYMMTRRHLQKTRNIEQNPAVSLVVPVPRRLLWFLPPATIQLRGRAEILDWTDQAGAHIFKSFWMGRRIRQAYQASQRHGETRICFVKITPAPIIHVHGRLHDVGVEDANGIGRGKGPYPRARISPATTEALRRADLGRRVGPLACPVALPR